MFEAEIMIAGYTIVVSTVTLVITKNIYKHKLKKLNVEIEKLKAENSNLRKNSDIIKSNSKT